MQIGCLGDIPFIVSGEKVLTPDSLVWSGSARYAEHQRHNYHALTEFTGLDPDKFTFNIRLVNSMGIDVLDELVKLWGYERDAAPLVLVLEEKVYGKHRWVVTSHKANMRHFDPHGRVIVADVSLSLLEYLPE